MITSDNLADYILLDAGDKEKLESWKGIILRRPDPMALWPKIKPEIWNQAQAIYHRSNKGGGSWEYKTKLPESWIIDYKGLKFKVSPTNFKHTGIFPEQTANWDFIIDKIKGKEDIHVLNLFAYSGAATMAASFAGAKEVVHVDASKGMNEWAKENMRLSHLENNTIRFIVDDCLKFMQRENRRGHKYQGIIMDPPSYGRGPNNELFKFEDKINDLICEALNLLDNNALFFIINSYTSGYSNTAIKNTLSRNIELKGLHGHIESDEIGIRINNSSYFLPCGFTTRWSND